MDLWLSFESCFSLLLHFWPELVCALVGLSLLLISSSNPMANLHDKIGQVYDAIDNQEHDKAIRICERSEMRASPIAQSLLAYSYAVTKKLQLALDTCRVVMRAKPTDEGTHNALALTLKILRKEDEMAAFYESLLVSHPENKEFMESLFSIYTRLGESKKMQLTAQKLYKKIGTRKYVFWTVGSMLQQGAELPAMMLTVAEKMLQKVIFSEQSSVQPGAEEVELYVEVLRRQKKIEEAYDGLRSLLERPVGTLIDDDKDFVADGSIVKMHSLRYRTLITHLLEDILAVAKEQKDTSKVRTTLSLLEQEQREILELYPDQWTAHSRLIELILTEKPADEKELTEHQLYLHSLGALFSYLRGPALAQLLLLQTWAQQQSSNALPAGWKPVGQASKGSVHDELAGLLILYTERFDGKQCCFSDIKPFLATLLEGGASGEAALLSVKEFADRRSTDLQSQLEALAATYVLADRLTQSDIHFTSSINDKMDNSGTKSKGSKGSKGKGIKGGKGGIKEPPALKIEEANRSHAAILLCSLCKVGQLSAFCARLLRVEMAYAEQEQRWLAIYELTKPLCADGVGGEREVQPGDELLLLASAIRREQCPLGDTGGSSSATETLSVAHWARLLLAGVVASPYSYAFRVELVDPLRQLGAAEAVAEVFSALKARHVQNDSLSYLLLPSLVEVGFFSEARRQHLAVVGFHTNARRDTAEMIGTSFTHANYAKGLEMQRFGAKLRSSVQLALSKTEMPLLELIENPAYRSSWVASAKYLEDYTAGDLPESMELLGEGELAALSDNNDYSLLVRADVAPAQEKEEAAIRKEQYISRISEAQRSVRMISAAANGDANEALTQVEALMELVSARLGGIETESDEKAVAGPRHMQWSQALQTGGIGYEKTVWRCVREVVLLSSNCAEGLRVSLSQTKGLAGTASSSSSESDIQHQVEVIVAKVDGYASSCKQELQELIALLLPAGGRNGGNANIYLAGGGKKDEGASVLDPQWVRRVAFFTRTVAPWASLLLKAAHHSLPRDSKGVKSDLKNKDGTNDSLKKLAALVQGVLDLFLKLLVPLQVRTAVFDIILSCDVISIYS